MPSATPTPSPSVSTGSRADDTLIRYADNPKVYVIEGGKKRWIPTAEMFTSLGYDWGKIVIIPGSETYEAGTDKTVTAGTRAEGTLIRYASSPKVYAVEGGKKHWIPDAATFVKLGYKWAKIIIVSDLEIYESGADKTPSVSAAPTVKTTLTKSLKLGMTGEEVKKLQEKLKQLEFFPADINATGYFGKITQEAVRKFQEKFGIDPVGYVGPQTRAKLNEN